MEAVVTRAALEKAIVAGIERSGSHVMQWGVDDCTFWAADIHRDAFGEDPASAYRGRYSTRRGAMRVLGRGGLKRAMTGAARRLGWRRIDPHLAQPGDVALVHTLTPDGKPTLATALCRKPGWFVARNERGFDAIPAAKAGRAWSVLPQEPLPAWSPLQMVSNKPYPGAPEPRFEPISLAILSFAGIEATAGAIAATNFIVGATLSVGFSLVSSLLQPHTGSNFDPSVSRADTDPSVQITERAGLPTKRVALGETITAGSLFFEQVKAPYLTMGMLLSEGQIDSVRGVTIATDKLQFASIAPNTILTPLAIDGQVSYDTSVKASFRYGTDSQTLDPLIANGYASVASTFRQQGVATAVMRYYYGANQTAFLAMWGQVARPSAYFLVRGVKVYDPRDPTQSVDDPTTWKWSNNATLVQAFYLMQDYGGRIPASKIRWDKIADSADFDDELIICKNGDAIKRHTIDGLIRLDKKPYEVLQKMLTANRAMVLEAGGKVWIESARPKDPLFTIHDKILTGGFKYQSARQKTDLINKLQVRFVAPDIEYEVVDGPTLDRTDLQATDGGVLPSSLSLEYTQDHRRAQRLQKAFLDSSRLGKTITCAVDIAAVGVALDDLIGSVATVSSDMFEIANGDYRVTSVGFSDDLASVALALTQYDGTIETDWDSATDEQDFELADIDVS